MHMNREFTFYLFMVGVFVHMGLVTGCMSTNESDSKVAAQDAIADLSAVPQIHETEAERDERMQWFRDAKFGMFVHWGQ